MLGTCMSQRTCAVVISGLVFAVVGLTLIVRPLTAYGIVVVLIGAGAGIAGVLLVASYWRRPWAWFAALALVAAAGMIVTHVAFVAEWLPYALAVVLGINAIRLFRLMIRPRRSGKERAADGVFVIANAIGAYLFWLWPDAATVVVSVAVSASFILLGLAFVVSALFRRKKPPFSSTGWRYAIAAFCAVISVLSLIGSVQLRTGIARVDSFYSWSGTIPETPGTVVRTETYDGVVPDGAKAVKILYSTTYSDGSPALASAVVTYPTSTSDGKRTVLAWEHGTTGVAQSCGPSVGSEALTEEAIPGISRAIERGWVIVATDYPGQGTSGKYPYLVGQGEGRATLDAIRAATHIQEAHASEHAWIWGHSQGGHAALWAGQIAADYAPDIDVLGVAALSAARDPLSLAASVVDAQSSALSKVVIALVLVPYAEEYSDVHLNDVVNPAGIGIVKAFASRCVTEKPTTVSAGVALALGLDKPLYSIDISDGAIRDRLAQNIASGDVPAPIFLGQGVEDEVIPISMQRSFASELCAAGKTVSVHEYAGFSHLGVVAPDSPLIDDLYQWADAVAQGEQPSTCQEAAE